MQAGQADGSWPWRGHKPLQYLRLYLCLMLNFLWNWPFISWKSIAEQRMVTIFNLLLFIVIFKSMFWVLITVWINDNSQKETDKWSRWQKAGAGPRKTFVLGVLLFDDERSHIVPSLVVVFGVGAVAVRELQPQLHNVRGKTQLLLSKSPFVLNKTAQMFELPTPQCVCV